MIKNMSAISIFNDDLHIFIPDDYELTHSMDLFIHLFSLRKKLNAEYWLLDVSGFESMNDIIHSLQKLELDFDDDLYLYNYNEGQTELVQILEYYEIHSSLKRKLIRYGSWNSINGLNVTTSEKWNRRKNLDVSMQTIYVFCCVPRYIFWCKTKLNYYYI